MKTEREIYNTIKWDSRYNETDFFIEYSERNDSVRKVPFLQYNPHGDIPWHRIKKIYYKKTVVWDRGSRFENLNAVFSDVRVSENNEKLVSEMCCSSILGSGYSFSHDLSQWLAVSDVNMRVDNYPGSFTFLSFNILCDTYEKEKTYSDIRYPKLVEWLKNRADIMHLQEVTPAFAEMLLCQQWVRKNYYTSDTDQSVWNPFGMLTLSRFPIVQKADLFLNPDKRPAVLCTYQISDVIFHSVNVHLSSNRRGGVSGRSKEIKNLLIYVQKNCCETVIIAGDCNFNDESEAGILNREGWIDIDRYLYSEDVNTSFNPKSNVLTVELSPMATPRRVDRIYLKTPSAQIQPTFLEYLDNIEFDTGRFLSDHYPLLADFILQFSVSSNPEKNASLFCLETEQHEPVKLVESDDMMLVNEAVRTFIQQSVGFSLIENQHGDSIIFSTVPANRINVLQTMLVSFFLDSFCVSDQYVSKRLHDYENSYQISKALVIYRVDEVGSMRPVDYLSLPDPGQSDNNQHITVCDTLKDHNTAADVISYLEKGYGLKLIGSYLFGVATEKSDIDFYSDRSVDELYKELSDEFDVRITGSREECLKFTYQGYLVDIQFNSNAYELNCRLAEPYLHNHVLSSLLTQIKIWAASRHINRQAYGYPGGTAWALLLSSLNKPDCSFADFLSEMDLDSIPESFTEMMTESSRLQLSFEIKRAKELINSGNNHLLNDERSFSQVYHYELRLSDNDKGTFRSTYLKLCRQIEKCGGLLDIVESATLFQLQFFKIKKSEDMLISFLEKEKINDFAITPVNRI